jgi:hypothetical protein
MLGYRPVRHIYFLEGCVFITLAIPAARFLGVLGILAASLISHGLITIRLSFKEVHGVLKFSHEIIRPLVAAALLIGFLAISTISFTKIIQKPPPAFFITGFLAVAMASAWFGILSHSLRHDLCVKMNSIVKGPKSGR